MCLETAQMRAKKPTKEAILTGYKVLVSNSRGRVGLPFRDINGGKAAPLRRSNHIRAAVTGRWLKAKTDAQILSTGLWFYQAGFHVFVKRVGAEAMLAELQREIDLDGKSINPLKLVVVELKYREVTTIGSEYWQGRYHVVHVANYMMIPKRAVARALKAKKR